jgi:hypothetical protein
MFQRAFFNYLNRFGKEICLFLLITTASSVAVLLGASPAVKLGLARIEIVGLAWMIVRILLAEDGFRVSGGWATRPMYGGVLGAAQASLLLGVVMVPLALRAAVLQRILQPDGTGWEILGRESWWPQIKPWLIFSCVVVLFGKLILRGLEGKGKVAAWSVLSLAVLPCAVYAMSRFSERHFGNGYGNSNADPGNLAQGIQRELKDANDFLGTWNDRSPSQFEMPAARKLLELPLREGSRLPNARIVSAATEVSGVRVIVDVRFMTVDARVLELLNRAIPVLRYGDGTCATCFDNIRGRSRLLTPLITAEEFRFAGTFISPLSQPEFEGDISSLLGDARLMFFVEDGSRDPMPPDPDRRWNPDSGIQKRVIMPAVPDGDGAGDWTQIVQQIDEGLTKVDLDFMQKQEFERLARRLPPQAVPHVFEHMPWSDDSWEQLVKPLLLKHADGTQLPLLLEKLESDRRLGVILVSKGWSKEAMPQLRKFAKERLPMEAECLKALAEEKDEDLTEDLEALALPLRRGVEGLKDALKQQPGFDWPRFAKAGWKFWKYDDRPRGHEPIGTFAVWAAREGDEWAFLYVAERAAKGEKWYLERLRELTPDGQSDVVGLVRENLGRMKFEAGKWHPSSG